MSAYYLLGYSSTNADEGRPLPPHPGAREARRPAASRRAPATTRTATSPTRAHRSRDAAAGAAVRRRLGDRPAGASSPAAGSGSPPDRYYVPVALAVPGSAVPVANDKDPVSLDVLGIVATSADFPVGRIRETLKLPPGTGKTLAGKQVLYQSGVTLPPGRFSVKVVVRENTTGTDGIVRSADRRARAEAGAGEGELGRAQHAAAAGGRRARPTTRSCATACSSCPTSRTSSARIRSCTSTTRSTIRARPTARRRSCARASRSTAAR